MAASAEGNLAKGEQNYDFGSSATSATTGGRISNGMIFNSSGTGFGLVKMLAFAGVALIALRLLRSK